jgi:hypothetical protein
MTQDTSRSETRTPVQNTHETDRDRPSRPEAGEHEGATENEMTPTTAPSGPEYEDEPKQG